MGKIPSRVFDRVIAPRLGAKRSDILVGPRHGVDVGIAHLGNGQILACSTDPFFVAPELGWERAAWLAVQIVASDVATSGLRPRWFAVNLNLPLDMADEALEAVWEATSRACEEIGMAIITGHTGRYEGCSFPMLGAATAMSLGREDAYVTPAMAQVGDAVLVTKGPAVEATGMFGAAFPAILAARLGEATARAAEDLFRRISVVTDALVAAEVGVRAAGVTSMHDATERGIWGAIFELADASGVGLTVSEDAIPLRPEVQAVCEHFGMDPFIASSEGTLLLTCRRHAVRPVVERLAAAGIDAYLAGEVTPASRGVRRVRGGRETPAARPADDPFWPAYARTLQEAQA
jgi:hydrogenase maturation factor